MTAAPPPAAPPYSPDDMMTVAAARALRGRTACFVGIGLPSLAANLARRTGHPDLVLVYESGTIGARPTRPPLSIGDGELAETADTVVSVPEMFNYWLQPGRIDVGFLGAAQIDEHANINTTVIGAYDAPSIRLPGAGGAPEIAASCREVFVVLRQTTRMFVPAVDFRTSVGFGPGSRAALGLPGRGPVLVITDLGILAPDPVTCALRLTHLHPGSPSTGSAPRPAGTWPSRRRWRAPRRRPPTSSPRCVPCQAVWHDPAMSVFAVRQVDRVVTARSATRRRPVRHPPPGRA